MIKPTQGDILKVNAEALVNPVNCVGVMGRGLALQSTKYLTNALHYTRLFLIINPTQKEKTMNSVVNAEGVFHLVLPEQTRRSMQKILNGVYEKNVTRISHGLNIYCFNPVKARMAPRGNLYELHTRDFEGAISITDGHVLHYYPIKLGWSCSSDPEFFKIHNIPFWRVILPLEVAKFIIRDSAESFFIRCNDKRSYLLSDKNEPICHWETDANWAVYDWSSLFQDLWPVALSVNRLGAYKAILDIPYQIDSKLLKKALNLFAGETLNVFWNNKTRTIILASNSHASAIAPIFKHD